MKYFMIQDKHNNVLIVDNIGNVHQSIGKNKYTRILLNDNGRIDNDALPSIMASIRMSKNQKDVNGNKIIDYEIIKTRVGALGEIDIYYFSLLITAHLENGQEKKLEVPFIGYCTQIQLDELQKVIDE